MLATRSDDLAGKRCLVSGSGNVAQYTAEKLIELGAKPLTFSDSDGFVHDPAGIDAEKLAFVMELKNLRRGRIREYADKFPGASFTPVSDRGFNPLWSVPADCAFPSATQNEINGEDARNLVANKIQLVAEGANMPTTPEGVERFLDAKIFYGPGKAANAGGVAVSGLEMTQDIEHLAWTREQVDGKLRSIMRSIHANVRAAAEEYGHPHDYVLGANIAGFVKVADAKARSNASRRRPAVLRGQR
jgi:glutamate dehydrogenase (NADP+)